MKYETGVVHGRFQIFHNEHLKYVLEGKKRCQKLIIGITNFDFNSNDHKSCIEDPHRVCEEANPLTFYERMIMIKGAISASKIGLEEFEIVPFPIDEPERISNFIPSQVVHFLTIYDNWGRKKKKVLEDAGYKVEVLYEKELKEKHISSSMVRERIRLGLSWQEFVPKEVYRYIVENRLEERIKSIKSY